jgi:drug/metabolite transporter (DMT)-like permease
MGEAPRLTNISMPEFVLLGLTGLANYTVGRNLYYVSIQKIGAGRTVPIANLSVLAAPILASLLLGELFTVRIGFGMVLVFAGVYLLTQRRR